MGRIILVFWGEGGMVVVSFGHGAALRGRPVVHWKREVLGATHACMMNERGGAGQG